MFLQLVTATVQRIFKELQTHLFGSNKLYGFRLILSQCNQSSPRHRLVMDYIFECFFNDTFEMITRNGLQDRQSRRDVLDHLSAIIKGCSDGQNVKPDEVAAVAVLAALSYHKISKDANSKVCLMGKYHNILYIALRACWDWGVRDSTVVTQLLVAIYECEKTFERIFLGALFGPHAPHFIAGWRSDFDDQCENIRAMVYFLKHATREKLTLPVWIPRFEQEHQLRFVDVPIESCGRSTPLRIALQASAPELLLILLRYGAAPQPPDGGTSVIIALLDKIIDEGKPLINNDLVLCLKILLHNIPMIEMPFKPIMYEARREMFFKRYGRLLLLGIISKEQVYGVPNLRHLCRCRIRDLLRECHQLPSGIDTLRLPMRLQRYIDLTEEFQEQPLLEQCQKPTASTYTTSARQRLETISSSAESEDEESDHRLHQFEAITDAEKAATAAFVAASDGAITEEAKQAAITAYLAATQDHSAS